ncbi:hypothetical protein BJY52DRAFT_1228634 [Lactarius psammicola]|nr:hypothetical protein BJY52DRAFT_1228634 [Lactarius psammicola]
MPEQEGIGPVNDTTGQRRSGASGAGNTGAVETRVEAVNLWWCVPEVTPKEGTRQISTKRQDKRTLTTRDAVAITTVQQTGHCEDGGTIAASDSPGKDSATVENSSGDGAEVPEAAGEGEDAMTTPKAEGDGANRDGDGATKTAGEAEAQGRCPATLCLPLPSESTTRATGSRLEEALDEGMDWLLLLHSSDNPWRVLEPHNGGMREKTNAYVPKECSNLCVLAHVEANVHP